MPVPRPPTPASSIARLLVAAALLAAALIWLGTRAEPRRAATLPPPRLESLLQPLPVASTADPAGEPVATSTAPNRPSAPSTPSPGLDGLPVTQAHEPVFEAFHDWLRRHAAAAPSDRTAAEPEGVELARRRRDEMLDLIEGDPRRALELALPDGVRSSLPPAMAALLEERVSGRGDLEVLAVLPEPGHEDAVKSLVRAAVVGDRRFDAFVYGRREGESTRRGISLHGIAIDRSMAVAESPIRLLEPAALRAALASPSTPRWTPDPTAHSANDVAAAVPVGVEAYGAPVILCCLEHAARYEETVLAAENAVAMSSRARPALASASGSPALSTLLFIRVDFSDLPGESITETRAAALARELHQFYSENSYGRAGYRLIGAGSAVTPVFRLPRTAASYGGNNDSTSLRTDARNAARAAGYVLTDYDFDIVFLGEVPGFQPPWSGLGYVGSPGAWIRGTTSTGTTAHELGHNHGLYHANFWNTGGESVTGSGVVKEYGDPLDTMGDNFDSAGIANSGKFHFNARYKRQLGWLADGEFTVATTNGVYRIHAQDHPAAGLGSRGLQVFVNARTNYWLEYRGKFTTQSPLLNGAGLRWASRDDGPTLYLDTTPGSAGGKTDAPIAVGRTYSDPDARIHLTPIARGGSNPGWLDIAVHRGPDPGNRPPESSLEAPATQGTTSTVFQFRSPASDPDGDALAYFWEFGDDSPSTNRPAASHRWTTAGDYLVRCTVSDTRGGVARHSVAIRVGLPGTFRLAGRVTADGEPVGGVRISDGASHTTLTDTDGTFVLPGLARGAVTLTAGSGTLTYAALTFTNPLMVTGDRTGLDFAKLDTATLTPVTLVPAGSPWRYWDQGTVAGTAWRTSTYNDSAWSIGPAILGYGDGGEATVIGFGPDSSRRYVTSWFRKSFAVEDPSLLSNLRLGLLRDDGAAVYLNGQEIVRDNLPSGTLTAQTLASSTVSGSAELTYFGFDVPVTRLVAGTNVLAVELHQSSASSSDTAFDLRLTADAALPPVSGLHLVRPGAADAFTAPARIPFAVTLGEIPGAAGATVTRVEYLANSQPVASATAPPWAATWTQAPPGNHLVSAAALLTDGRRIESTPVSITVRDPGLDPVLIPAGSFWRYLDTGVAPAADWTLSAFDDNAWLAGLARLGYGEDGEFTVVRFGTDPLRRPITTWFRHQFDLIDAAGITNLLLRLQRDDGAVVYLNGREIFRTGLRTGAVTPTLLALADIRDDAEMTWIERRIDPPGLVDGPNLVAVELHQVSASSLDLGFDLELRATRGALPSTGTPTLDWRMGGGTMVLLWPATATGWRLQTTPTLGPTTAWVPAEGTPIVTGDRFEQSVPTPDSAAPAFYRLIRSL